MATHSNILAWRIPGTGKPGGLLSMGSHRVGHDWSDLAAAAAGISHRYSTPPRYLWTYFSVSSTIPQIGSLHKATTPRSGTVHLCQDRRQPELQTSGLTLHWLGSGWIAVPENFVLSPQPWVKKPNWGRKIAAKNKQNSIHHLQELLSINRSSEPQWGWLYGKRSRDLYGQFLIANSHELGSKISPANFSANRKKTTVPFCSLSYVWFSFRVMPFYQRLMKEKYQNIQPSFNNQDSIL